MLTAKSQRVDSVKKLFEHGEWYLQKWRCAITIRAETVREFVGNRNYQSVLDIGCGDGSISTQLLRPGMKLTLNDLSSTMLSAASGRISRDFLGQVEFINEDILRAKLSYQPYDLVVCLGVLAHVESPSATIDKINSMLTPGGTVIVECTDNRHPLTRLDAAIGSFQGMFTPPTYTVNPVMPLDVIQMFESRGFNKVAMYRHVLPMLGMARLFSASTLCRMVRALCGFPSRNRNAWLGNHYIFQFEKNRSN